MFANINIGNRLNLIVTSINVVILFLIALIAIASSEAALRSQSIERFGNKSHTAGLEINALIQTATNAANAIIAGIDDIDLADSVTLRAYLTDFIATDDDVLIERINIMRPDTAVAVLTIPNPRIPQDYVWRVYSRQLSGMPHENERIQMMMQAGEATWFRQDMAYFDAENRPAVTYAIPFASGENGDTIDSLIWVDIAIENLQRAVTDIINENDVLTETVNGFAVLWDDQNGILTQNNLPATQSLDTLTVRIERLVDQLTNRSRSEGDLFELAEEPVTGVSSLFQEVQFATNNWRFIASLPEDEIPVVPSSILAPIIITSILGVMTLIWVLSRTIETTIVYPLRNLSLAAQEIGSGDMRYHIGHQSQMDEIGYLSRALESMKQNLAHSYNELSNLTRTLEERVRQRTRELAEAQQEAANTATELRAIYDDSLVVVNEAQLQPVLNVFIERILGLLNATYSGIWLLNEDKDRLQMVATNHPQDIERTFVILRGDGVAGQTIERGEPIRIDNYHEYPHRIDMPGYQRPPLYRAMCVPLMFASRPIGAVVVGREQGEPAFTLREQRLLELFANLVSPSVRNAQLFVQKNRAVQEAERANEVKTRFLASVTHELRTPLNLIINNMDFMSIGAFGDVTEEQQARLKQTTRSAEHLLYLVNDLLDVSKIASGEMQLFIQPSDVYTMLEDTVDNTLAIIDKMEKTDSVTLISHIEDNLPEIPMDARRIRQVLTNLLSNAVKFTPQGHVTLVVKQVETGIYFSVQDTGIGIPEEEMAILFEAFERTRQAKENKIEGTGLGLPISQYLVQQHGDKIEVTSQAGEGSTFFFTLPFEQPEEARKTDTQIIAVLSSKST